MIWTFNTLLQYKTAFDFFSQYVFFFYFYQTPIKIFFFSFLCN